MKQLFFRISDLIWVIVLILIDRLAKIIVQVFLEQDKEIILVKKIASLRLVLNEGAIFSLPFGRWILVLGTVIILVILGALYLRGVFHRETECLGVALVFAGAVGNLVDRLFWGRVIDWLSVSFWPAFNFADVMIVFGVILMGLGVFRVGKEIK